jgi:hypothetical protein
MTLPSILRVVLASPKRFWHYLRYRWQTWRFFRRGKIEMPLINNPQSGIPIDEIVIANSFIRTAKVPWDKLGKKLDEPS